jgi:hypothetical protein
VSGILWVDFGETQRPFIEWHSPSCIIQPMRRVIAVQACLTLLLALYMAPFQHVHLGVDDDHEEPEAHHHSNIVHSHQFIIFIPAGHDGGANVTAAEDDHRAISLDTYAAIQVPTPFPVFLPGSPVILSSPAESYAPVEFVEVRGHDPPALASSAPRAPPA